MTRAYNESPDILQHGAWTLGPDRVLVWVPNPGRGGRPRKPYTMPASVARAMHGRYFNGERTEEVLRGHAEYQRRWLRAKRSRLRRRAERAAA